MRPHCSTKPVPLLTALLVLIAESTAARRSSEPALPEKRDGPTNESQRLEVTSTSDPVDSFVALYRLNSYNGAACLLMRVDGLLTFQYKTKSKEEREADKFIPNDAEVTGHCYDESSTLNLRWSTYFLTFSFIKVFGGERWYIDRIELAFNTSEKIFEHIDEPGKYIRVRTPKGREGMLFPTPVGKSFVCSDEIPVVLSNTNGDSATLLLRQLKVQPFIFKKNEFGPEFACTAGGAKNIRDETTPIAVGSTLAIVTLLTITGYGVYRYFKIKKVQYDTME